MYCLIRKDMPRSYQAVQAGHAVAEYIFQWPNMAAKWDNNRLIYLNVDT